MSTLVLAFGRMNPPTCGHVKLWRKLEEIANREQGEAILCLSKTQGAKKNPLSFEEKSYFIRNYIEQLGINIGVETDATFAKNKTIFQIMPEIYRNYKSVNKIIFVCGSDRDASFESIIKYNGEEQKNPDLYYEFDSVTIESSGERIDDSDDIATKASASLMRQYVKDNDFESFSAMCPDGGDNKELAEEMFAAVQKGLHLTENVALEKFKRMLEEAERDFAFKL